MADDIVWNEAQGHPYADLNPYVGPDAILSGLFARIGGEWDYFTADPQEYIVEGERLVVIGHYEGRHTATGNMLDALFVHVWTVQKNQITTF
ncbi:MAG: nuclear transport factor 2 family protein [Litorimonas sp.]